MQTELKVMLGQIFLEMAGDPVLQGLRRTKSGDVDTRQRLTPEQEAALVRYRERMANARRSDHRASVKVYRFPRDRFDMQAFTKPGAPPNA